MRNRNCSRYKEVIATSDKDLPRALVNKVASIGTHASHRIAHTPLHISPLKDYARYSGSD